MGVATRDDSYAFDAGERLTLNPPERLDRAVASANAALKLIRNTRAGDRFQRFDPFPVLHGLEAAGIRFVLIGTLAGALRGSPLLPVDATVALTPASDPENSDKLEAALAGVGASPSGADDVWSVAKLGVEITVAPRPPGTFGYADLSRDATRVPVAADLDLPIASLLDLVRMAEAAPEPRQHAQVVALRATLERAESGNPTRLAAGA